MLKSRGGGVYRGREGYILGVSHIVVEKEGGYILGGRGRFWEPPGSTPGYNLESTQEIEDSVRSKNLPGYSLKGGIIWSVTPGHDAALSLHLYIESLGSISMSVVLIL